MAIKIRTNLMLLLSLVGPIIGPTAVRLTLLVSLTNLIYAQDDKQQKDRQKEEISRWIAELGQGQPGDNNQATTALIGMGTEAIPYLLKVFESNPQLFRDQTLLNDHWIRLRAAHCLSQLNYTSIINILMRETEALLPTLSFSFVTSSFIMIGGTIFTHITKIYLLDE